MRNRPDTALIFAAGFGTRMRDLTRARPKPLVEVAGQPLLDHALAQLDGVPRRFANTHYLADVLRPELQSRGIGEIHEPEILETGGGLKRACATLDRHCVVTMNSDAVWTGPRAAHTLAQAWDEDRMDALLLVVAADRARGHVGRGDFALDADGAISRGGPFVYTGAQIIGTQVFADTDPEAFSLNVVWDRLIAAGRARAVVHSGGWCDVGRPESIAIAETMLAQERGAND